MDFEEIESFRSTHRQMSIRGYPELVSKTPVLRNRGQSVNPLPNSSKINLKLVNAGFELGKDNSSADDNSPDLFEPRFRSMSRLGTIREEMKLVKELSSNKREIVPAKLPKLDESNDVNVNLGNVSKNEEYFMRKRSNSMFASFQNLIKKDEDNIKLLLPLEKDQDLILPFADAVLELQLEYMDKFHKADLKKFMRRKSCHCSFCGKMK